MSLSNGDLRGTIFPKITVDDFEPKAGSVKDVIVVTFYVNDLSPATDLNTFIQRGSVKYLDVQVSPNTDPDGNYLVFVELLRNKDFPKEFEHLLKDVQNVSGKMDWKISTYLSDNKTFSMDDSAMYKYIILNPKEYISKAEFYMRKEQDKKKMKERIETFFKDSMLSNLTIEGDTVIMSGNNRKVSAEVVDIGDYDSVIGGNFLSESAFNMDAIPREAHILNNILGNYQILPINRYLCVNKDDSMMLLKNTKIIYKD